MKIQLIRNATMKINYAGKTILTDPMLSPKNAIQSFAGVSRNPTIDLPLSEEEIVGNIDGVLVSHLHPDHWDEPAAKALSKILPILCQPGDEDKIAAAGFQTVRPIESSYSWDGITVTRTGGRHGKGKILELMGEVSGFVLQADGEPTVYWVGDSIWCADVEQALASFSPDVIVSHAGGATIPEFDPIIMDAEQTLKLLSASSDAVVVAVHLESLDHCAVTREALRQAAEQAGIPASRLIIPGDGEAVNI